MLPLKRFCSFESFVKGCAQDMPLIKAGSSGAVYLSVRGNLQPATLLKLGFADPGCDFPVDIVLHNTNFTEGCVAFRQNIHNSADEELCTQTNSA